MQVYLPFAYKYFILLFCSFAKRHLSQAKNIKITNALLYFVQVLSNEHYRYSNAIYTLQNMQQLFQCKVFPHKVWLCGLN